MSFLVLSLCLFLERQASPACHLINRLHVLSLQHLQASAGGFVVAAAFARHLAYLLIGDIAANEFLDIDLGWEHP